MGIALLAGATVWFATGCNRDGNGSSAAETASGDARIVSTEELDALPTEIGHAVFWAGEQPGTEIEYSADGSGNVHLRYLTDGASVGSAEQTFLDVGTYPFDGAYQTTKALAAQKSLTKVPLDGGVGFYDPKRPYSVILAFPDEADLQIEVYHPEANGALDIVRGGDIVPVP